MWFPKVITTETAFPPVGILGLSCRTGGVNTKAPSRERTVQIPQLEIREVGNNSQGDTAFPLHDAKRQASSHLISSHLISSHLISSHLISSHLISSHLISLSLSLSRAILSVRTHLISPSIFLSFSIFAILPTYPGHPSLFKSRCAKTVVGTIAPSQKKPPQPGEHRIAAEAARAASLAASERAPSPRPYGELFNSRLSRLVLLTWKDPDPALRMADKCCEASIFSLLVLRCLSGRIGKSVHT